MSGLGFPDNLMAIFGFERVNVKVLPNDICRCLDDDCKQKDDCQRYRDRNTGAGGANDRIAVSETLNNRGDYECEHIIRMEDI